MDTPLPPKTELNEHGKIDILIPVLKIVTIEDLIELVKKQQS